MPPATNDNEDDENIIYLRSRRDRREPEGRDNEGDDTTQRRRLRNDADEEEDNDEDNNNPRRQRVRVDEASYDQGVFADNYVDNENNGEGGNPQPAVVVVPPPPAIVPPPMPTHTTNTIGIAAALRHAYPSGYSRDAMKEELAMQANIKGDNQAIASFRTEILQQQGLTVFAFLQQKDMTIHLLHSPATYYARGASGPLRGKDIGFVGDRSPFSTPAPIILQPEKPWKWITKQIVTEPTTFEYFYANPANTGKFFTATAGATLTRVTAPRLLLLPGNLVQYCAEAQRTPWDLHQHVTAMVSAPGAGHDFQHYQLVLDWCCMALTSEGGDSALQYDLQAAASNEIFHRWARMRIDATLGPQPSMAQQPTMQPAPAQDLTHLSTIAAEFGKGVIEALRPSTATPTLAAAIGTTLPGEGVKYDTYQKAILRGFSHCPTNAGLQPIWGLFSQTKNIDTHRLHLREAMIAWSVKWGVTITGGIELSKIAIEDIVNLRFNPGGSVAYYATAEKGISILLCRNRPGEERESARLRELAAEESAANITMAEALALRRNAPQSPPDNYIELKTCIGTFCAMLWALFGDQCEYLKKLHEIYTCLNSDRVTECWANFEPLFCRQLVWAIIDDGREYFSQKMLPDKFVVPPGGYIAFPQSSLEELIRPIKRQSPIESATFPSQWLIRSGGAPSTTALTTGSRQPAAATTAPVGTVFAPTRTSTTNNNNNNSHHVTTNASVASRTTTASSLTGTTQQANQRTIRQTNVHQSIKDLLEPFILRHGQLQLTRIMMVAGVTWPDMPKIDRLVTNGTNHLCYNFILGKCTSRYCTHRRSGHINATDVPDAFATSLCNVLRPGIEQMTDQWMTMPWTDFQTAMASRRTQSE